MWYASFPTFGEWHVALFRKFGADTVRAALRRLPPEQRPVLVFHTDEPGFADLLNLGSTVEYHPVTAPGLEGMNQAHREVIRRSQQGDWISCLQADFVISGNFFEAIRNHMLLRGKHAVVAFGTRVRADVDRVPIDFNPRSLLNWAWENRHDIVKQLEVDLLQDWMGGRGGMPGHVFFIGAAGKDVVVHSIHVHPICFLNNGQVNVNFTHEVGSSTTLQAFDLSTIHMVTDPDDVSYCDLLEIERTQPLLDHDLGVQDIANYLKGWNTPLNRWQFERRICLVGDPYKVVEMPFVDDIMRRW